MKNYPTLYDRLQAGLSMIEVLVSLTIVAFGVLGLLGLQARALSFQRDSFDRRIAAEMVAQLAERMRANHLGLTGGLYAPPTASYLHSTTPTPVLITPCAIPTACTIPELAFRDWTQWIAEYRRRSPGSAAYTEWDLANDGRSITVSVAWPEPQSTGGADPLCVLINARLGVAIPANYRCFETAVFP
jgi:type IV pilus assembly protein PilV